MELLNQLRAFSSYTVNVVTMFQKGPRNLGDILRDMSYDAAILYYHDSVFIMIVILYY